MLFSLIKHCNGIISKAISVAPYSSRAVPGRHCTLTPLSMLPQIQYPNITVTPDKIAILFILEVQSLQAIMR